jgi:hypothetical protein
MAPIGRASGPCGEGEASAGSSSICSRWVTWIIGPFRHSTQPRTLSRLPASVFTSIPAALRASLSFPLDEDGKIAVPVLGEVEIDAAAPFPHRRHHALDELVTAREATQTLHIIRIQNAVGGDAPHTEALRPRLGFAG